MPQYWVLLMRMPVPENLRIPGWDTDKFVYKRVEAKQLYRYDTNDELYGESVDSDSSSEADSDIIELYGTIIDAYKYYKIVADDEVTEDYRRKLEPYKISDDGVCQMCFEEH